MLIIPIIGHSQEDVKTYEYKSEHYYESIDLLKDGTFKYYNKTEFSKNEIDGNWQLRNDSILVLDSRPQRSKIKVFETRKRTRKTTFCIRSMNDTKLNYSLYLITKKNDTVEYKNQFDKTITLGDFSSFYIVDTKGLYTPKYKIIGTKANYFEIWIEEKRVFENEFWKFYGQYIVPLGLDGKYSNYNLYYSK